MLSFVFRDHARLAVHAALLFAAGAFAACPAVCYRWQALARLPLAMLRFLVRLMGPAPGILRVAAVIFGFNGLAIFLYMASGIHPVLPKLFALWTGFNVCVVSAVAGRGNLLGALRPADDRWRPPPGLAAACGLLVLLLELPCFWLALAMGMSMGHAVRSGAASYPHALGARAAAYAAVILPLLLLSALAEAVAIGAQAGHTEP